jgi:hypothetical protein
MDTIKKRGVLDHRSQSQQLLIDGEAGVQVINSGRIYDAVRRAAARLEWNELCSRSTFSSCRAA